jgi:phage regulator Rha-like protein
MEIEILQQKIYEIGGQRVMLDYDLAELYEVETKRLKEAVRRNLNRFPIDFMFELSREEYFSLRTQIASLENGKGKHSKYNPFAFTEHGVTMLSSILKSERAIEINISVVRAFVHMRQYAFNHKDLTNQLKQLENQYNKQFDDVFEAINYLMKKDTLAKHQIERKKIGF